MKAEGFLSDVNHFLHQLNHELLAHDIVDISL